MTADSEFGAASTTDEVLTGVDLTGTTALVTGTSSGLGVETVRALATRGASVIATARNTTAATRALAEAGVDVEGPVTVEELDLASLDSVRGCAERVLADTERLNILIANAGVMACPEGRTADGFETQFGTNHLGHFLLVNLLTPLLVAGAPSRVVFLSSSGHRRSDVDLDDPNFETTDYDPWAAYGRSKTANVLCAVELDRRLADQGVRACAVHPGGIDTGLFRHLDEETLAFVVSLRSQNGKTVPQGAATGIWAAVVADADAVGGRYAEDCAVADVNDDGSSAGGVRSYALDADTARRLWELSEKLVDLR